MYEYSIPLFIPLIGIQTDYCIIQVIFISVDSSVFNSFYYGYNMVLVAEKMYDELYNST